ncbi:LOW QUALITY PROTEIN: uncharacterized protein LOC144094480 [Amblyomma americanum]
MPKSSAVSLPDSCCVSVLVVKISLWCLLATGAATSDAPVVRIDSGLLSGQRMLVGGKELYAYLGIPYAQPPIGDLRFRKPVPVSPWEGVYNASSKPKPCRQLPVPLVASLSLNYSGSSEDCLQINVWLPSSACPERGSCVGKLPVIVFIHGGGFQWGDSALFLHDPANFVALSDVVFVTFNYRVGLHGFLSLEVPELPGNVGLWDQNLALKWVRKNIASFGGDPDDVTIDGQSAGAISVALHAVSPHSKGLFKRAIMQSGAPLSLATSDYFKGKGRFINVSGTLGCYDPKKTLDEQLAEAIKCLRDLEPAELIQKLEKLDFVQHAFTPVDNDEFLPFSVSSPETWNKLNVKEVMLGTTENEAGIFFHFATESFPKVIEVLLTQYRTASTVTITQVFGAPLFQARRIVGSYFRDGDEDLTYEQLRDILGEMIGDALFYCPALLFADSVSESGIKTYRYEFAYRPSHSFYPNWMGVAHGEDVMYTLGSLPFIKDKSRYTEPFGKMGKKFLATQDYTKEEEEFMKELVGAFNSFARTGKPVIPHPDVEWPEYTMENRRVLVLKPNNYTVIRDNKRQRCELWKPVLYKSDLSKGTRATTTAKPIKPGSSVTTKKKLPHPGKGRSASSSPQSIRLPGMLVLAACAVACLNARLLSTGHTCKHRCQNWVGNSMAEGTAGYDVAAVVKIDSGLVSGVQLEVGGRKKIDAYLGIPYAEPPVRDLRFRKPVPASPWFGVYNATAKPLPCHQVPVPLLGLTKLNYSTATEDCLYVNVWKPSQGPCTKDGNCAKRLLPVVVYFHGGAFQWGDSSLLVYDPASFVALTDVVFVTFNYRLGIFGFLSLEPPEMPSNIGLWDQHMVLKWVRSNIASFGGDPNEVTIGGQSAGATSAALHAASPQSKGLFKRLFLQSGSPLSLVVNILFRGEGKLINIAALLGCYDLKVTFNEQRKDVVNCLRNLDAGFVMEKLGRVDFLKQLFSPLDRDEFLPFSVLSSKPWQKLNVEDILLGTTTDEGTMFFSFLTESFPQASEVLATQCRTVVTIVISQALNIPVSKAREVMSAYFGGHEIEHSFEEVRDIICEMFADAVFNCPAQLFADDAVGQGIQTHRYLFAYKSTHSFFPKWMGVAHTEDLFYTVGSLPFLKDKSRYSGALGSLGKKFLATRDYTSEEEEFIEDVVGAWGSFVHTG